jgi:hypothetical protein
LNAGSWIQEIENRIVAKAGNTPVWKKEEQPGSTGGGTFGSGLSADDVDRIAAKFVRDLSRG